MIIIYEENSYLFFGSAIRYLAVVWRRAYINYLVAIFVIDGQIKFHVPEPRWLSSYRHRTQIITDRSCALARMSHWT